MAHAERASGGLAAALTLAILLPLAAGCHTTYQCPILQPLSGGTIPAPLPPEPNNYLDSGSGMPHRSYVGGVPMLPAREGDAYRVIGYREGLRFYVVQYNDKLYRGGDILSRKGAESLRALGIKTIVSVTPSDLERKLAREFGFKLVEIPFEQNNLTRGELDRFLAAMDAGPSPVYVHCFGGDLRAGILVAHYRIHKEGWTFDRALREYRRLDANTWDAADMVRVLRENARK